MAVNRCWGGVVGLVALSAAAAASAGVGTYTATMIPSIPGGFGTIGRGVNEAGWVVGQADNANFETVGFVHHDGQTFELPNLAGGYGGEAVSVNSAGTIVGSCYDVNSVSRAVKWTRDMQGAWQIEDLGTLDAGNGGFGVATRINEAGQIVGYCSVSVPGPYHACLWDGATKTDLGTLGFSGNFAYSQALGINEAGDVTGFAYAVLQGPEHGMYYTGGRGQDITPPDRFGLAQWHNVNSSGMLGGYISSSNDTQGAFRPALYVDREGYTIVPLIPGLTDGYGYDLNDDGVFVGTMFLPQPEPEPGIFRGFVYYRGETVDLGEVSTGLVGTLIEAKDISNSGLIVGTADLGM